MKREALVLFWLLAILILPQAAQGREENGNGAFSLYWENDALARTDSNYTNGVKLTWTSPWMSWKTDDDAARPDATPWYRSLMKALPIFYSPGFRSALFLAAGQDIYTPTDTDRKDLIVDDRPYAGYSYVGIGFLKISARQMDTLEVDVGIVGRHSYAEDLQEEVHRWLGNGVPGGWANQLSDEPTLEFIYERKWKWLKSENGQGWGYDLIPHLGGRAGNVYIYANAGAEFRLGWNRPNDFGTCPIRPGCETGAIHDDESHWGSESGRFGVFFFLAVDGRAVLRDIFLDGNTFQDSHSVKKESFVADLAAGLGFAVSDLKITYAVVYRTQEFESQPRGGQFFGSLLATYSY